MATRQATHPNQRSSPPRKIAEQSNGKSIARTRGRRSGTAAGAHLGRGSGGEAAAAKPKHGHLSRPRGGLCASRLAVVEEGREMTNYLWVWIRGDCHRGDDKNSGEDAAPALDSTSSSTCSDFLPFFSGLFLSVRIFFFFLVLEYTFAFVIFFGDFLRIYGAVRCRPT